MDEEPYKQMPFEKAKRSIDSVLAEGGVFPGDGGCCVNPEIKDLVYEINKLPFAYTTESCSGHFVTREDIKKREGLKRLPSFPKKGTGLYFNGDLGLVYRLTPTALAYISEVKALIQKSKYASIEYDQPVNKYADAKMDKDDNSNRTNELLIRFDQLKKRGLHAPPILSVEEGLERRRDTLELIEEIYKLTQKYNQLVGTKQKRN
jgi:hypothetical protein